ncbi:MAG: hypothetical protein ACK4GL_05400 [Flavobacteriales bacterium]
MQLFALVTHSNADTRKGRTIVEQYLRRQLSSAQIDLYLSLYYEFVANHQHEKGKKRERKQFASNAVKILKVCTRINEELTYPEKIIVICRLAEFLKANDTPEEMALDFAWTLADTFNISKDEFQLIYGLIFHHKDWLNHPHLVRIAAQQGKWEKALFLEKNLIPIRITCI